MPQGTEYECNVCGTLLEARECTTCRRMDLVETAPPLFGAFEFVVVNGGAAP